MTAVLVIAVLALGLPGVPAGYLLACWRWPLTTCSRCKGAGKFRTSSGRAWRRCRKCKGSGEQRRDGTVFIDWYRRRHEER